MITLTSVHLQQRFYDLNTKPQNESNISREAEDHFSIMLAIIFSLGPVLPGVWRCSAVKSVTDYCKRGGLSGIRGIAAESIIQYQ